MSRYIGKAAVVALAVLLLAIPAVTALGGIGGSSNVTHSAVNPEFHARRTLRAVESQVRATQVAVADARERIRALDGAIAALETDERTASAERVADLRRLVHRTDAASEQVARWRPTGRPTLLALAEPLQVVSTALHEGVEYRSALLATFGELAIRTSEVEALRAEAAAIAFALGRSRAQVTEAGALAIRTGWIGIDGADRLVDDIRELAGRVDSATMSLRQQQARILSLSIALTEEGQAIRDDIKGARAAESSLVSGLVSADSTIRAAVVSMLGDAPWGPFAEGVLEVCPVDMPNAYTDNWLAPRYGGGFHLHQGIDIFAAIGTPIRAPFPGTAVAVPNSLGGLAVSVYGAEGYVYNAHLSEYGTLGEVRTGDVIGYVGMTGNASGPHDHFEWHPAGGPAVNPFEALNAACRPV